MQLDTLRRSAITTFPPVWKTGCVFILEQKLIDRWLSVKKKTINAVEERAVSSIRLIKSTVQLIYIFCSRLLDDRVGTVPDCRSVDCTSCCCSQFHPVGPAGRTAVLCYETATGQSRRWQVNKKILPSLSSNVKHLRASRLLWATVMICQTRYLLL